MPRITFAALKTEFKRVLLAKGCDEATADLSAQLLTETSCDGVYSHGVNRFARVVDYIEKGYIKNSRFFRVSRIFFAHRRKAYGSIQCS